MSVTASDLAAIRATLAEYQAFPRAPRVESVEMIAVWLGGLLAQLDAIRLVAARRTEVSAAGLVGLLETIESLATGAPLPIVSPGVTITAERVPLPGITPGMVAALDAATVAPVAAHPPQCPQCGRPLSFDVHDCPHPRPVNP